MKQVPLVLSESHPQVSAQRLSFDEFLFASTSILYFALAVLFSVRSPQLYLYSTAGGAAILGTVLAVRRPSFALSLVTLATHLGPIVQIRTPLFGMINLGDLHLALTTLAIVPRWMAQGFYAGPFKTLAPVFAFLLFLSVIFSPDPGIAALGALNMIQLGVVYFFTLNEIRTRQEARRLLIMIGIAVIVSGLLHIYWYSQGTSLLLANPTSDELFLVQEVVPRDGLHTIAWFQKTSFFYVSFIASCSVGMVLGLRYLLLSEKHRLGPSIFWATVMVIPLISSLVSGNRTPILAAVATGALMLVFGSVPHRPSSRQTFSRQAVALAIIAFLCLLGFLSQQAILFDRQRDLFPDMFLDDADLSMGERFQMWEGTFERVVRFPKEFLIGIGPDVPARGQDLQEVAALMKVSSLGAQPTSFHNFYIDVVFQLGIWFFLAMIFVILMTVVRMWKVMRSTSDDVARDCLFGILTWLILWNSHATGWSKPVLILAQLFGLAHLLIARRMYSASVAYIPPEPGEDRCPPGIGG